MKGTSNELNKYIVDAGMVPITVGYSAQKTGINAKDTDSEIDVYVWTSQNQL